MDKEIPDPSLPRYGYIQPRPFDVQIESRPPMPKQFHMDHFFGNMETSGGGPTIQFASGYVVCYRHGFVVAILDAVLVPDGGGDDTILRIDDTNPDYPVIDGIGGTQVTLGSGFSPETGASGDILFKALALNHYTE